MKEIKKLNVFYHGRKVGTMALYKGKLAAYEYDKEWVADGFSISPFSLPLEQKVFIPKMEPFDGIYGIFADSLPDGWGRLLVDRLMLKNRINPYEVGNLNRLGIVGNSGMGALTYEPDFHFDLEKPCLDFDKIAEECSKILKTQYSENLDELFQMGGSSGGARPKILTQIEGKDWIVKFPSSEDGVHIGKQEYEYSLCAKECGIEMEETKLFNSKRCDGYFGTKRYDRRAVNGVIERIHMISVSALLETSHRIPNLDYEILMKLTLELTKEFSEIEKLYRLMCFNVFAHNRDDHSKNFTYLYKEKEDRWVLSPAYDLTYSYSIGGEHATMVHGNGRDPGMKEILLVAKSVGLNEKKAKIIAEEIYENVKEKLGIYLEEAKS
ncbi:type II toxin-antitoxin system HipA family toxin [uncultured Robinsoniella sp.]|uniref:type II toxin-antitoxin system HipA family toxin n=1 Tax=uncultured Robinsoniella sp. TaxID=904190 RepID=UPI00374F200D